MQVCFPRSIAPKRVPRRTSEHHISRSLTQFIAEYMSSHKRKRYELASEKFHGRMQPAFCQLHTCKGPRHCYVFDGIQQGFVRCGRMMHIRLYMCEPPDQQAKHMHFKPSVFKQVSSYRNDARSLIIQIVCLHSLLGRKSPLARLSCTCNTISHYTCVDVHRSL